MAWNLRDERIRLFIQAPHACAIPGAAGRS
jgi:hypothetical protein